VAAVWARARADLRSGWRRGVGLTILIGLIAGAALAAALGARRTDSALDRFNRQYRAADVLFLDDGSDAPYHAGDDVGRVSALPFVATVARARFTYTLGNDGLLVAADDALGRAVNRIKVLKGRLPHPDAKNEVAVVFDTAKRNRLRVGSTFPLIDTSYPVAAQLISDHPDNQVQLTVAAIVGVPGSLPPFQPGTVGVLGTPALYQFLATHEAVSAVQGHHTEQRTPDSLVIRLRAGQSDVSSFARAVPGLASATSASFRTAERLDGDARRSMHLQAQALWLLATLLAFSGVLVLGQTISRFIAMEASEASDLRALGMTGPQLGAVTLIRMGLIGAAAAAVAVVVAVAASPLTPLGLARTVETAPGVSVDTTVLVVGAAAVVGFVLVLSAYPAWRAARRQIQDQAVGERVSVVAGGFAKAGLPPTLVAGTRMALEPGRGRSGVPVRSTILGAAVGIAALTAALTFGTSLARLLDTPRLYGVAWDARFTNYGGSGEDDPNLAHRLEAVARQRGVAEASAAILSGAELGGRQTGVMAVEGRLRPPVLEGRYPNAADEVALGAKAMRRVRAQIGSHIELRGASPQPVSYLVVGKTVLPADGDPRVGEGILMTADGADRLMGAEASSPTPFDSLFVRFAPGVDRKVVVDRVQSVAGSGTSGGLLDVLYPQKPTDLVNFGGVSSLPFVLAGILAVVAIATLAHLLVSAVRRRRRDLAILKTLGFSRRQVTTAVLWQGTILATVALIVGIPVGVGVGRWLWNFFATAQGVVVEPRIPVPAVLLVVPAAIVLACVVAAVPARVASLVKPALVLRTE